jgi:tetratricopeptide (TPR) repeat protein
MLPPLKMLATKKQVPTRCVWSLTVAGVLLFNGCTPPGPRALLKGERLAREGRFDAAIVQLETATRLLPQEARAWNHLGLAYHGAGRSADAVRAYQQALSLDHNLAAAQYNLGCLHLERGDLSAAISALTTFTGLQPQSDLGWLKLGTACLRAGQYDAAERHLNQALQNKPQLPDALNGLGLVRMQRKNYAEANRQFEAALRVQTNFAPALLNSAIVAHQFLNDRAAALQKYERYLALKPQPPNFEAVERLARQLDAELHPSSRPPTPDSAAQAAGGPKPAESEGSLAKRDTKTETRPPGTKPPSAAPPASAPNRSGSSSPAVAATGTAPTRPKPIAPEPAKEEASTSPRPSDAASRVQPPSKAPSAPTPVVSEPKEIAAVPPPAPVVSPPAALGAQPLPASRPVSPRYHYQSPSAPKVGDRAQAGRSVAEGLRLQERYQMKEAIEKYREALEADPACFDAYYNLGVAAFDTGDLPQTLTAYEYALALDATSRKARFNFAVALERAGYPRDAAQELERLLASYPTETRAQFNLAHLYADRLGETQRAKAAYLRVLELAPQHPQATAIRYWLEANP